MNPNQPPTNTGSFGAAIGGADPIKAAMQRRGMVPATSQSSISPNAAPMSPTGSAPMPTAPQSPTGGGTMAAPVGSLNSMGTVTTSDQDNLIIQALSKKMQSNSKIQEAQSIPTEVGSF